MKHANDLGKDKVSSLVLRLAIPSMLSQLVNVLYGIIDRMFIGHIPIIGNLALAGVGVCGPIVTLLSSFGTLVGIGGSIMMAMKMGEGKKEDAKDILSNSFLMLVIFSTVLTAFFLLTKRYMINWFGGSPLTYEYANTYLTIYTIGTFFALLAIGLNYFITCQGFALIGMMTVFVGAISNIILDAVFIFVFKLGVAGAAWATVISQFISCICALIFLFGKRVPIKITFANYKFSIIKKILSIGLSPFIIIATDSVIIIAMNSVLQKYGGSQGDVLISAATILQS
ncbi:MAG: MATE family efflux transporter, partial [Oscillospiraceae bacterium]